MGAFSHTSHSLFMDIGFCAHRKTHTTIKTCIISKFRVVKVNINSIYIAGFSYWLTDTSVMWRLAYKDRLGQAVVGSRAGIGDTSWCIQVRFVNSIVHT